MVRIPGGTFRMGSDDFYPEERPALRVTLDAFWMDAHPVTNAAFRRFAEATGYVTVAERRPDPADYSSVDPAVLVPGSLVFRRPPGPVPLYDPRAWWAYVPGACWHRPEGPASTRVGATLIEVLDDYADALAEAGGRLYLSGVDVDVATQLRRAGKLDLDRTVHLVEEDAVFGASTERAVASASAWLGRTQG